MGELQEQFFILLGLLVFVVYAIRSIRFLKYFYPKVFSPLTSDFFPSMGEWAVITGATDGIGKEYAFVLAKHGLNIVLISRTLEKLQKVAIEIEHKTGRTVKIIKADFTKDDVYEHIEENLRELEIGILVNNVGMIYSHLPSPFLDMQDPYKNISNMINCNMISVVKMTKIVLPQMAKRRKGLILNVSSGIGSFPCPLYCIYSASKCFVEKFSRGLQAEYRLKGIIIQCVAPYGVSTPMIRNSPPNSITKTAEDYVRQSLEYVTFGDKTYGCLAHEILAAVVDRIPLSVIHNDKVQEKIKEAIAKVQRKTHKDAEK
ncbi:17-beta-hydroxysteroid dehydrogenase type 3 [Latimeria chalumnae]|uniref:Hydroxysteroid 17-beta dehydrogenase 3 n=1 Tax=Latimeria chalumnae TaxID=7897 RepID=M3XKG2_LATCH|nr:PREDICTED: testosterone 17-beta-dehydrogenase 3 [Latimeria chalumnae]|eukprot:XP_006001958.1 PREDICTED: testosterone 17-beta-dehydrogenase 3 [Latimeria chalumnae]